MVDNYVITDTHRLEFDDVCDPLSPADYAHYADTMTSSRLGSSTTTTPSTSSTPGAPLMGYGASLFLLFHLGSQEHPY